MDRAAERDWNEQAKQVFQLSTVNDRGHFLPPTPTEKGYKENVKENEKDYFATIVSTPPERVRTFLSTESTISPGMFSLPSSKIKRHTIPSYSPPVDSSTAFNQRRNVSDGDSCNKSDSVSSNAKHLSKSSAHSADSIIIHHPPKVSTQALSESVSTPSSSPSSISSKDAFSLPSPPTTPQPQQRQQQQPSPVLRHADVRRKSRAQISFLTGSTMEEEDLTDVLSDTLSSLLLSSSPPELVMDEGDHSSSSSGSNNSSTLASPNTSPRHSLTLPKEQIQKMNTQKLRSQYNFGSDQQIGHL
ncbi:hypothetical protein BGZ49_001156 [Haplosporangium sp. Z 27]|nr:hypothetical protein BGZ49_001156 [Haplosporangium sp. Z 27]